MAGSRPEERVAHPAVQQTWRHVTFLHWRIAAEKISQHLPPRLTPDVVAGSAWVGVVAFLVERFRVAGLPAAIRPFPETNVRTYVRDARGRDGVWFLSLDVPSLINLVGGRALGVPYRLARMSVEVDADEVRYVSSRRSLPSAANDLQVKPGAPVAGADLELAESLAGRWRAFSHPGRLIEVPVEHEPWSLRHAQPIGSADALLRAIGLQPSDPEPIAHYASGPVHARLGVPRMAQR